MDIPPELLGTVGTLYQGIKQMAVDLVMDCHDPDYETTLANVRRHISEMEERTFQLRLFEGEETGPETDMAASNTR